VAYSAVGLNEKPMDGQSIWENLVEEVSGIWVVLVMRGGYLEGQRGRQRRECE
jgi:hypothetical protein